MPREWVTELHESRIVRDDLPFSRAFIRAEGALCPDGKRRTAHRSGDGYADTFSSIPAFVYVGRTRVYGYISTAALSGSSVCTDSDPETVFFRPYRYRKHHQLIS